MQRVSDILEGGQDRTAILFGGLSKSGLCGALPMPQDAGIKDGLGDACGQVPKAIATREQLAEGQCRAARIRGQGKAREPVGNGDANLGASSMQVLLGLTHIRSLLHELRRKAQWQFPRKLQSRQLKTFRQLLVRKPA